VVLAYLVTKEMRRFTKTVGRRIPESKVNVQVTTIPEILMNVKTILISSLAALTVASAMTGIAAAAVCYPNGNCVCFWHSVWVQTGPYAGQGYWTQVCD
jgi:hypothetical protein